MRLSLAFFLIFFGYNAVQQYITTFFSEMGITEVGFRSLIIIYLLFFVSGPLSAIGVSRYGAKKCMMVGSVFYFLFIFFLPLASPYLIYATSILAGFAASLLWTGQNSYLVKASDEKEYGKNSGLFYTLLTLGSAAGILLLGFLVSQTSFKSSFLIYSLLPIAGLAALTKLKDLRAETTKSQLILMSRVIANVNVLQIAAFYFAFSFIFGLAIGIIPINIKGALSLAFISPLMFLFWMMPILLSYVFGKTSDITGRRNMIFLAYGVGVFGLVSLYIAVAQTAAILLISGVFLLALAYAIYRPISFAFVGDVATEENLVSLTAFFWMAQNIGVLSALLISSRIPTETSYLAAAFVVLASLAIFLPTLKTDTKTIRLKLSRCM